MVLGPRWVAEANTKASAFGISDALNGAARWRRFPRHLRRSGKTEAPSKLSSHEARLEKPDLSWVSLPVEGGRLSIGVRIALDAGIAFRRFLFLLFRSGQARSAPDVLEDEICQLSWSNLPYARRSESAN